MKLRVTPIYNKMWRQSSPLESHPTFVGVLQGVSEQWAHLARLPRYRRVDTCRQGMGLLGAHLALTSPRGVPAHIQPRGEP